MEEQNDVIIRMTIQYYLSVTIDNVEFAKDFQYFITVQYQNDKKRSDLSVNARNPIFTCNTFLFPIENPNVQVTGIVSFTACVVLEEGLGGIERGTSKILGQVNVDLYPLSLQASETFETPMRQQLRFIRGKDGKQVPVGRFIALFKVINESSEQSIKQYDPLKIVNPMTNYPDYDSNFNFSWRVLAHIRSAGNLPSDRNDDRGLTPRAFVEIGWSEKEGYPNKQYSYKTNIIQSKNPQWNNCFLIYNPAEEKKQKKQKKGYICLALKNQNSLDDVVLFSIPVQSMSPFVFYNLNIQERAKKCNLIISLVLQAATEPGEALFDLMVTDVMLNPLPKNITKMSLLLNTETQLPKVQFYKFDRTKQSITRLIEFDEETKSKYFSYEISQVAKYPLKSSNEKNPTFVFTVPERMINKSLLIYLLVETDDNPSLNGIPFTPVAVTGDLSADLNGLLIKKTKKKIMVNMKMLKNTNNPLLLTEECKLILCTHSSEQKQKQFNESSSNIFGNKQSKISTPLRQQLGMGKSRGLFLEQQNNNSKLSSNNEIVNRLLKQLDEKNEAVKITAAQVIDLRKQLKLMQSENNILRHQAIQGEQEIKQLVLREISDLDHHELKDKIIRLAGMYKGERVKVKELENVIKTLEPQVAGNMQLQSLVGNLENKIKSLMSKQGEAKKEIQRISLYKDTIKKQEKVITKLEKVITDSMKDIKKARQDRLELEQYRKNGFSGSRNNANEEIQRLQKIIAQLQQHNNQKSYEQPADQSELQFRLYKAQQRCSALEQEISNTSKNYAKDVARLKLIIAEKQALLDGFTLDMD